MWHVKRNFFHGLGCIAMLLAAGLVGCDGGEGSASNGDRSAADAGNGSNDGAGQSIVLYCGRSLSLVEPVIERFEEETGIDVEIKDGSTTDLAALLRTESESSPADVFWAQDPGSLGSLADAGLFAALPAELVADVPERFVDAERRWVATSGRARVLAYAPDRVDEADLPASVFDLTDPKWRGRIGWAPSNGSFQAFVSAMRATHGEQRTLEWLKGVHANDPKVYLKNTPIIEAIAAGEVDLGLPNHYYLLRFKDAEGSDYPVEQTFFEDGDIGNLIMVSGAGVLKSSDQPEAAQRLIDYLLSESAQRYFAADVFEYPVVEGVAAHEMLIAPERLAEVVPNVPVERMAEMEATQRLLREAGLF